MSFLSFTAGWPACPLLTAAYMHGAWVFAVTLAACAFSWPLSAFGNGGKAREPILAGTWYEGDPRELAEDIGLFLEGRGRPDVPVPDEAAEAERWARSGRTPAALIVPHAGHVYSGACAGRTFRLLRGMPVHRVLLIGPSHKTSFAGAALPSEQAFRTPLGPVPIDLDAVARLSGHTGFQTLQRAHATEHSLEIELPFLQTILPRGFLLVPIVIGHLDPEDLRAVAAGLASLWDDHTVLVVSTDFTHYGQNFGYFPFHSDVPERLRLLDMQAVEMILEGDAEGFDAYRDTTGVTICGAEPIRAFLEAAKDRRLEGRLIDYYRSGDLTDDFETSVSYAGLAFFRPAEAPLTSSRALSLSEQEFLLREARSAVRAAVLGKAPPEVEFPPGTPGNSPLRETRGVFVTLTIREDGQLRGCIGSIVGEHALASGVIHNATAAAVRDPRFVAITPFEEQQIDIEISVLSPLERIRDHRQIVLGRDGVLLEKNGRRAVFLPQVAPEQGWDVEEMLRHLSLKAGLDCDAWKSGATLNVFQAQVFSEAHPASGPEAISINPELAPKP